MKITPLDIKKQEFRKSFNGYDKNEVETFLQMVSEELEELIKENTALQERIKQLEEGIETYKRMEKTLQDTLTSAQITTDNIRKQAIKEAEIIVGNAKLEAKHIVEEAENKIHQLNSEIKSLQTQKSTFIARLRGIINAQLKVLEQEMMEDETKDYTSDTKDIPDNNSDEDSGGIFKIG